MRLLIMGPPGAGKGTQAAVISQQFDLPWISTGQIFRDNISNETELGKLAHDYISRGEFVPDEVTNGLVASTLADLGQDAGFLLDGYPRTLDQARFLDGLLADAGAQLDGVLYLDVPEEEIITRLLGRAQIEGREDDTEPVIKNRIAVFHSNTQPLLDYYQEKGQLVRLDGLGTLEDVRAKVIMALEDLQERSSR